MDRHRRGILLGAAAALAASRARAQTMNDLLRPGAGATPADPMVLRRPPRDGEDPDWYALAQRGPHVPSPRPQVIPFGHGRLVVHWPQNVESGQLVVFSHGALADPQIYRNLLQHWASHGFVVVAPVHDDAIQERGLLTRRATSVGSAVWEVDRVLNDAVAWQNRVEQCGIALEQSETVGKAIGMRLLTDKPVIAGHDFGAYVVQLVMGADVQASSADRPFAPYDERWFAGIAMSPQGPGVMGLTEASYARMTRPLLAIEAALETDFTGQTPLEKIACYTRSPANYKHLAWFERGLRTIYAGTQSTLAETPIDGRMYEDVKAVTTAFLNAYANYEPQSFSRLQSDWPERGSEGRLTYRFR